MIKIIAGIDYSMSCPCMCVHTGGTTFSYDNCKFYYLIGTKKYVGVFDTILGVKFAEYSSAEERFDNIAAFFADILKELKCDIVGLEGYAMAARGLVFHIGENTGILKNKLWKNDIKFEVFAPTLIKKFATGKGNSKKEIMYETFKDETSIDLCKKLNYTKDSIVSPVGDIVDSYFICKQMFTKS